MVTRKPGSNNSISTIKHNKDSPYNGSFNLKDYCVIDIETTGFSRRFNKITAVCIYDSTTKSTHSFLEHELDKLYDHIENKPLVGHNISSFDIPFLKQNGFQQGDIDVFDTMRYVQYRSKKMVKLDTLCKLNISKGKSDTGSNAVRLYRNNKMEELVKYCEEDVKITAELFSYGLVESNIKYDLNSVISSWKSLKISV